MKLKEFMNNLQEMIKENPEILEFDVIYSSDDDGNGYGKLYTTPMVGLYEDGEFTTDDEEQNAICIN